MSDYMDMSEITQDRLHRMGGSTEQERMTRKTARTKLAGMAWTEQVRHNPRSTTRHNPKLIHGPISEHNTLTFQSNAMAGHYEARRKSIAHPKTS
jgi:hypothetical protein